MATHRKLMTLFSKKGFSDHDRHEFIYSWTDGRTQSSTELTQKEIDDMCENLYMERLPKNDDAQMELLKKKKRGMVLAIATRIGIHDPTDWKPFNDFMKERSILKKALNKYSLLELDRLISQFKKIELDRIKSQDKKAS